MTEIVCPCHKEYIYPCHREHDGPHLHSDLSSNRELDHLVAHDMVWPSYMATNQLVAKVYWRNRQVSPTHSYVAWPMKNNGVQILGTPGPCKRMVNPEGPHLHKNEMKSVCDHMVNSALGHHLSMADS